MVQGAFGVVDGGEVWLVVLRKRSVVDLRGCGYMVCREERVVSLYL